MSSRLSSGPSTRVNSEKLQSFNGKSVTLLGTVSDVSYPNRVITLLACDNKNVSITFSTLDLSGVTKGQILDVVGMVNDGKLIGEEIYLVNSPMDMDLYNQAINFSSAFPTLF